MTKFEDNLSPYLTVVEQGSTPSSPSAGNQKLFVKTSDHLLYFVNSSGTVTAVGGSGGFTPAVGVVNLTSGNVTNTSSTFNDITGLSITMTTGAHRVLLCLSASIENNTNTEYCMLDFTVDSTRQFGGAMGRALRFPTANMAAHADMTFLTAALTAGSHTFKVQWHNIDNASTNTLRADGTNYAAQFWAIEQAV